MTQKVSKIAFMGFALSALMFVGAGCETKSKMNLGVDTTSDQADVKEEANTEKPKDTEIGVDAAVKVNADTNVKTNVGGVVKGDINVNVNVDSAIKTKTVTDNDAVEIKMTANDFTFSPSEVRVKLGQKVRLIVTSADVLHGLAIPAFNVKADLPIGQAVTVQFTADQKGSFPFFCSVFCGSGHRSMKGTLIVE